MLLLSSLWSDYYLGLELHDELEFIERTAANKQQLQKLSDMYYTLQLLTALLTNSSQRLQEAILNIPRGITRLMDMLMDREDIQKIVIFEGAFEKILSIIRGEGNSDDGVVVQDFEFQQIVDIGKTLPLFMELQTLGDRM
ncbi:hypothetical protein Ahy_A05g024305 [Arachis hypogaea]|uniref:Uncharacterized protein n=1 Tax=Arachis hypogaea TaxID=3818 RepID=A0A445D5N0_ARAHY|nr:hypothetical protein Ahy_A05g024305 [Arachis hypogaea]